MLDLEAAKRITRRAQEAGLLYPVADAGAQLERGKIWLAALNAEGITEREASLAIVELARRTGEDRIAFGRAQVGHVIEAAIDHRRRAQAAAPPSRRLAGPECETCRGSGWEHVERGGVVRVRPCACRGAGVSA